VRIARAAGEVALRAAGWLAAFYVGFVVALFLVNGAGPALGYRLAGVEETNWLIHPLVILVVPAARGSGTRLLADAVTLLLTGLLMALLLWRVPRAAASSPSRAAPLFGFVRVSLHLAALWAVGLWTLRTWPLLRSEGRLARLLEPLVAGDTLPAAVKPAVAVLLLGVLLVAGWFVLRRLGAEFVNGTGSEFPSRVRRATAYLFLALPVLAAPAAVAVTFGGRWSWSNAADFSGPAVVSCLLLGLAFVGKPVARPAARFGASAALLSVAGAGLLYAGLANADRIAQRWQESAMASVRSEHFEVLYDPAQWSAARAESFAAAREAAFRRLAGRVAPLDSAGMVRLVVHARDRLRRVAFGNPRSLQVEGRTARIFDASTAEEFLSVHDAKVYLSAVWGSPGGQPLADWAALWLAGEWNGQSIGAYAARVWATDGKFGLAEILEGRRQLNLPPSVTEVLGAAWLGHVAATRGLPAVRGLYALPSETSGDLPGAVAAALGVSSKEIEEDWEEFAGNAADPPASGAAAGGPAPSGIFFRGMSMKPSEMRSSFALEQVPVLHALGANAIALVNHVHNRNGQLQYHANTADQDRLLIQAIRRAHELGMKVLLKPHVYSGGTGFAGTICVEDPAERSRWMRRYRNLILHYARIAQDEAVDLFSVGNELGCLTPYEADWRALIADVRRVYHGPLTYAANWGEEFETLRFWDALDYIGLNNYYPLADSPEQGLPEMRARARELVEHVEAVQRRWNRPVLFTEAGYPSRDGGVAKPWGDERAAPDPQEQADGYQAVIEAFGHRPWLRGVFWWAWYDGDFSPAGKPAEQVLRAWYQGLDTGTGAHPR